MPNVDLIVSARLSRWIVACFLLILGTPVHEIASSAPDPYTQLRDDIESWATGPTSPLVSGLVVVFSPPLHLEPNPKGGPTNGDDHELQTLVDDLPLPSEAFSPAGRSVIEVYRAILKNRATERFVLSEKQAAAIRSAECVLLKHHCWWYRTFFGVPKKREPSERLLEYQALTSRIASLQTTLMRTSDVRTKEVLLEEIAAAQRELDRCGNRQKVESAISSFRAIQNQNPERFWDALASKLLANSQEINGELVPQTRLSPASSHWRDPDGWS